MAKEEAPPPQAKITASQRVFKAAPPEVKDLIKRVLGEERKVMHMKRRSEIHNQILEHVKRVIQ